MLIFFKQITEKINLLKEVENHIAQSLSETINAEVSSANRNLILFGILSLLGIFLAIVLSKIIASNILKNLDSVKTGVENFFAFINFEKEDISLINVSSSDELGIMSAIINKNIENTKINITFKIPTEKDKIELFSISKINTRKIEDNKGLVFTTLEYIIQYIKSIEFTSKTKNILLTDLTTEIYPFVAGSNLMMQDKIMKSMPEDEFLKYQPKFYYNVVCKNPNCNHEYKYNIGNVEDEFFRKTLSLYR